MSVEEQMQWVLIYVQRGLVNIWKENVLKKIIELKKWSREVGQWNNLYKSSGRQQEKANIKRDYWLKSSREIWMVSSIINW